MYVHSSRYGKTFPVHFVDNERSCGEIGCTSASERRTAQMPGHAPDSVTDVGGCANDGVVVGNGVVVGVEGVVVVGETGNE